MPDRRAAQRRDVPQGAEPHREVAGERAYALARKGNPPVLAPREVFIERLELVGAVDPDHAVFAMHCGKGTYVRAFARDVAVRLGTRGHLAELRRTAVGPFREEHAISLDKLEALLHSDAFTGHVRPVETALADIPALAVTENQATRLRSGQTVHVLRDDPGLVRVAVGGRLVALAEVKAGKALPVRVFNI